MERKEKLIYWLIVPIVSAAIPVLFGWQSIARLSGWIRLAECPGAPVVVSISSPGNGVLVPYENRNKSFALFNTTFVVETSRPLSEDYDVGLLTKAEKDSQYYLRFWTSTERDSPNRIRKVPSYTDRVSIPLDNHDSNSVEVMAIVVDSYKGFGERYSEISQVTNNKSMIAISPPIVLNFIK